MIELVYTSDFLSEINWLRKNNKRLFQKVRELARDIIEHPTDGKGKPERLKYYTEIVYSRKIDKKNRLTYQIIDNEHVKLLRCLGHYDDK